MKRALPLLGLLASVACTALSAANAPVAQLTLRADQPGPVIHRNVYGHFSEHLGRCIYEGIWVGPD